MYRSDVRTRLRGRLDPRPTPTAGPGDRLAAVLLPLVEDDRLVLTRRTEHLSRHPGEISFPGGLAQEEDTDLANGTRTLMLAHAVETLPAAQSHVLVEAFASARHDRAAREAVWTRLRQPDLASGYDMRITVLQDRVSTLLEELAAPSDHRDLIQWMINVSADRAKLTADGGVQ